MDMKTRKKPVVVSFSGGQTSAYMAWWLHNNIQDVFDLHYVFANTGAEGEETLRFINRCATEWCIHIHWIEADVNPESGKGTRYRETNFINASRNGDPFEDVIKKYGIPNQAYPHCTRELKLAPINAWVKANRLDDRLMAVGIRADEVDRVSPSAKDNGIIYPLIQWHPTTIDDVNAWWDQQPFKLEIPQFRGNCTGCWKKSFRKLGTIYQSTPEVFEFYDRMEREYGLAGANVDGTPRTFFRGHKSVDDIKLLTLDPDFKPFAESEIRQTDLFWDAAGACSESCDIYAEDYEDVA
jgi:3'-phosphoadenosine 5'-phosphosulfate sulfotransferase (PAPS reductase)/FAD synthetase